MDSKILLEKGISASNPRKGYLQDFSLKIGARASLIPCKNERSYGIVMTIDDEAIHQLYSEKSVADYIPEEVEIILDSKDSTKATCYNLPAKLISGRNEVYAKSLYLLAKQLKFPKDYLERIRKQ